MKTTSALLCGGLLLAGGVAYADPCKVTIESNDLMRFSLHEITVPADCSEAEVTLKHSGVMSAKAMGHDWVLAKDSDMPGIVNAGLAAGPAHGYLPEHDKRIIAATPIVGGGESTTVKFATSLLQAGSRYVFFCTSPGHATVMRGTFLFGNSRLVRASDPPK